MPQLPLLRRERAEPAPPPRSSGYLEALEREVYRELYGFRSGNVTRAPAEARSERSEASAEPLRPAA